MQKSIMKIKNFLKKAGRILIFLGKIFNRWTPPARWSPSFAFSYRQKFFSEWGEKRQKGVVHIF